MRKRKMVCRMGGGSERIEKVSELIEGGMNVGRVKLCDGDFEEDGGGMEKIGKGGKRLGKEIGMVVDRKGGEMGRGRVEKG